MGFAGQVCGIMHHIHCEDGEAKFWIEPIVSLATYYGLKKNKLNEIQKNSRKAKR